MGRRTLTISVSVLALLATVAGAVNPPPRPLHKVGDHWTPYQPPAEFPSDAQVYVIQPGDTLWDLAKRFLGDPYLWPQIWEQNKYITDAHWIYPGDPLVIQIKAAEAPPAEQPPQEVAPPPTPPPASPVEEAVPESGLENLVLAGSEDDVYCFAYVDEVNVAPQLVVASGEKIQYQDTFAPDDIVYLSGGDAEGVKAGQEFFLVSPGPELHHPATHSVIGRVMRYIGHLRVLCTQEHTATAEVLSACDPIEPGTWLKPFEPIPIPMVAMTPMTDRCQVPNEKPKGFVVFSKDEIYTFGQDHDVIIDLGEADQVSPGTVCTIYRDNPVEGMPRVLLGELAVLTTGEHWATAKVIQSTFPMSVGDRIEVK